MPNTQDIRRRIKSIQSTRQITRAMELVSAAKMRKAQAAALASRTYARLAWELLQRVTGSAQTGLHRLLRRPTEISRAAIVLLTSNRGLIGAFNNNVIYQALAEGAKYRSVDFVTLGKKGRDAVRKRDFTLAADFEKADTAPGVAEISPVARLLVEDFISGKYDRVVIVYPHFVSTLQQQAKVIQLLPLQELTSSLSLQKRESSSLLQRGDRGVPESIDYLFEPTADQVLETLLPRLVTMQIYQALVETNAAEHSARMVAMKNASDAAKDLVSELTLEFNQIRQAGITKEISEIVSGSLAIN